MDKKKFILHLKIGIIKELYSKKYLTLKQMDKAIKQLYRKEAESCKE